MKINDVMNKPSNLSGLSGKDTKKPADNSGTNFQSHLKHADDSNYEDRIHNLVDRITEQGSKFEKKIDIMELKAYKGLIQEFLGEALTNSHKFSKKNSIDRRGRHRVFALIKKVNEELDTLTKDVLNAEKDNIAILKRLDDIRGLIMDLFL